MKQGIRLFFVNNPVEGDRIAYDVKVNGISITYLNGLSFVDFEFTNNQSEVDLDPFHRILIGSNIDESAENLLAFFLNNSYKSSSIEISYASYQGDTYRYIDIIFETSDPATTTDLETNENLQFNTFEIPDSPDTIKLRYSMEYTNSIGDTYKLFILNKNYTGDVTQIHGRISILKNDVKEHTEPIRGTGLRIQLEADETFEFDDLYSIEERDYPVRLDKNNLTIYNGYLNTEGAFQSYTEDRYIVNLECVDGLGFLENLSFVDSNGVPFFGKMSCFDVIHNCLARTGFKLRYNVLINLYYTGLSVDFESTNILSKTFVNTERFYKSDGNTIMSCKEVLVSILSIFKAVITQENGEWFIFRPSDLWSDSNPKVLYFTQDKLPTGWRQFVFNKKIGSHIDNFYPYHCNRNQKLEVKKAISAFRLNYKYGFIASFMDNGKLQHTAGTTIYPGWTVPVWTQNKQNGFIVIDPVSTLGMNFKAAVPDIDPAPIATFVALRSDIVDVIQGYSFEFKCRMISYGFPVYSIVEIILSDADSDDTYFLSSSGVWQLFGTSGAGTIYVKTSETFPPNNTGDLTEEKYEVNYSVKSEQVPVNGTIQLSFRTPRKVVRLGEAPFVELKSLEFINTFEGNNVVGEFHTATRMNPTNSVVKDNQTIYNGDNGDDVYTGALFKEDGESLTSTWYRKGFKEEYPILRILAEDELRLSQNATRIFSGDIYGQIPYFTLIGINKIPGRYLPISYSFDTISNVCSLKLLELNYGEIPNILYDKTNDYGETIKPTIAG